MKMSYHIFFFLSLAVASCSR